LDKVPDYHEHSIWVISPAALDATLNSLKEKSRQASEQGCCPKCKTKSLPMNPVNDVTINVNTHELRILGIWAENYAVSCDNKHLDDVNHESMKESVNLICDRIYKQLPESLKTPLTLSAELKDLQKTITERTEGGDITFYRDGKEEII
jgi:hypothetical protein